MATEKWHQNHGSVISDFLLSLNKETDHYVLKGGMSLTQCYGLDRFSEDIGLDKDKLAEDYLDVFEQLGIISDGEEAADFVESEASSDNWDPV